jgi:hypothetical protein
MDKQQKLTFWVLGGLGIVLWLINWWTNRALFIDEANVARNLYEMKFAAFFTGPLRYDQYAPPLYLVAAKACGEVFGYGERALRLPALLSGLIALFALWRAGNYLKLGWWALLPISLLIINPTVLRYTGELKPYAGDLGVAALLTCLGLSRRNIPWWAWLVGGATAVWASLPAIFVLSGVGLANFLCILRPRQNVRSERLKWLVIGAFWLLAFGLLYVTVLRSSVGSGYLRSYHEAYFFPLPAANYPWKKLLTLSLSLVKTAFGFTLVAIVFGVATTIAGLARAGRREIIMLGAPLVSVLVASGFGFYSLLPRLLLFVLPAWWLIAAIGSKAIFEQIAPQKTRYLLAIGWIIVLLGTNVVRHYWSPMSFSDARRLVAAAPIDGHPVTLLHQSVIPAFRYYRDIHPDRPASYVDAREANIKDISSPGDYLLLYDVLTHLNIRRDMDKDIKWATARGCKVRTETMYRAAAVYVFCPVDSLDGPPMPNL